MKIVLALAVIACALGLGSWFLFPVRTTESPPDRERVTRVEHEKWTSRLAEGGAVEFDQPVRKIVAAEASPESEQDRVVEPHGPLTPKQKAVALERLDRFLRGAEDKYRRAPTGTREEMLASLNAALEVILYDLAMQQVRNDEVWTFIQDGGQEDFRRAWRNRPRGWKGVRVLNVAATDDGKLIDMISVVNPAEHSALQSVLEQIAGVREMPR